MNNRIFELAKQADMIEWDTLPSGAITPDHTSAVKAKNFAKMIIEECIEIVEPCKCGCTEGEEAVITTSIISEIKKHFGLVGTPDDGNIRTTEQLNDHLKKGRDVSFDYKMFIEQSLDTKGER